MQPGGVSKSEFRVGNRRSWFIRGIRDGFEVVFKPLSFRRKAHRLATAVAFWLVVADAGEPLGKLGSLAVERSENAEGSAAGESPDEVGNLLRFPSGEFTPLDGVFCNLGEIIGFAAILDLDNFTEAVGYGRPLAGEFSCVYPARIHQHVQMKMPATAFICDFDAVEPAAPVAAKFSVAQPREPLFDFVHVAARQRGDVLHGEDNVFRLADFDCPPCNGCGATFGKLWLTFWTVEAVAPVAKDLDFVAVIALSINETGMAIFENFGFFTHPGFAELGRDRDFVGCGCFP